MGTATDQGLTPPWFMLIASGVPCIPPATAEPSEQGRRNPSEKGWAAVASCGRLHTGQGPVWTGHWRSDPGPAEELSGGHVTLPVLPSTAVRLGLRGPRREWAAGQCLGERVGHCPPPRDVGSALRTTLADLVEYRDLDLTQWP